MYNCRECLERLYPFLDRELNQDEQDEVRDHLNRCGKCRTRFRFEGNMLQAVGEVARATNCPDEARKRILRACGREIAP
jgi:mycothiol system anti-sigma-R factor